LYDAYAVRVWRSVARLMGPRAADVADVVQDTFMAAARSARTYDPARGTLWVWVWGIARVHVALHYRKLDRLHRMWERLAANGSLARHLDGQADALAAGELAALVRATLTELPADYEMLLTAKYLDGESVEAIAERERTTDGAVRSKLARARQAFREAFVRHAPEADRPVETQS
jgi:RNA polymerase sigma-70 factor (ECF subfamily)